MGRTFVMAWALLLLIPPGMASAGEEEGSFKLPAGSTLEVRLMNTLSTRTNKEGDPFSGRIMDPIFYKGEEVLPVGSTVEGRVTFVKEPGHVAGRAQMRLLAETITTPQDVKYTIVAGLDDARGAEGASVKDKEGTIQGGSKSKKGAAKEAGIGAGVGAGVGAIAAGGTGALYGAGIGVLAAAIHTIAKRGKDVTLPQGTELTFVISRDSVARRVGAVAADKSPQ